MTETQPQEAEPIAEPAPAAATAPPSVDGQPRGEAHVEHARNSIVAAVESLVGKVSDTLSGLGGRK
ncbi:MAG: hypothetical protein ABSD82_11805 [Solirubrobacteraceae bacterium]|jgi:hypothetical protein